MKLFKNNHGWAAMVGGLVALLITIIIGVLVFYQVNSSITLTTDTANTSRNQTLTMAATVFNLLPVIALVAVAGVILAVILGFGRGRGKI